MRRLPWVRIGVSLVLGVVITLGTAWVLPRYYPFLESQYRDAPPLILETGANGPFSCHRYDVPAESEIKFSRLSSETATKLIEIEYATLADIDKINLPGFGEIPFERPDLLRSIFLQTGYPFRCFYSRTDMIGTSTADCDYIYSGHYFFQIANFRQVWFKLRLHPIWTGLVANVSLYSLIAYVLLSVPMWLRILIRRRRGHCSACGYDLAGVTDQPCPECGREPRKGRGKAELGAGLANGA